MTYIVLIDKNCNIKQTKVKDLTKDNLYKKCGFKSSDGFEVRTTWDVDIDEEKFSIELWSKEHGKANFENKYDFPPPVDSSLYFGTCALIRLDDDTITDLTSDMWNRVYEKLFGGFEDLGDEEDSDDELENVPKELKTKSGYLKDDFVVDDNEDDGTAGTDDLDESSDSSYCGSELGEDVYNYSSDASS
jgi:hypothetical protein